MNIEQYTELRQELTDHRLKLSASKREDYTRGDEDVLANFKNVAKSTGLRPDQVLLVYAQKQFDAVANYVKTGGQSESEPIKERISDVTNYMELLWGLINDPELYGEKVEEYSDTWSGSLDSAWDVELQDSQEQADRYWQQEAQRQKEIEYWETTLAEAEHQLDMLYDGDPSF
jgi:hypothetical protein